MRSRVVFQVSAAALLCGVSAAGWAETIKLKEGGTVDAQVLQVQDDQVIVGLPREAVVTVNGKALPPALGEGVAAPAFTATDLNGTTQSVGQGKAKVTLLHFWVHWCPHCRSDAPVLQSLYDRYRDNPNVRIVTVNLDQQQEKVIQVVKERRITYPVVMASAAHAKGGPDIPELYQITAFPVTLLIDGQGMIRYKKRGSFVESQDDLGAEIQQLLSSQGVQAAAAGHSS